MRFKVGDVVYSKNFNIIRIAIILNCEVNYTVRYIRNDFMPDLVGKTLTNFTLDTYEVLDDDAKILLL